MRQALALARRALGRVSPNPAVGAVLVKDGRVVGQGHTQPPGQAHAEIVALRQAGDQAKGATLYVTLEPCPHHGRTPPCTEALVAAAISKAHIATLDPNPRVDGGGKAALEAAGIQVTVDPPGSEDAREARRIIEAFAKHITTRLPFVTAKFAMSLDGKIATATRQSRWISGEEARREAHQLRAENDAVMVGIGTALADNPRLTARDLAEPPTRQPLRVIVDSQGRLPASSAMLKEPGHCLVATANLPAERFQALKAAGAEVVSLAGPGNHVDLPALLRLLGERDVTSVLVEGGSELLGSLFALRLVDKVVAFVAPVVIGGQSAPSPVGGQGARGLAEALQLRDVQYRQVGRDMMVAGYPAKE
jgi:diaminohydroxyphosphoribosylaminopyrimidine deaminase/5-amino-6-(5-phosphoribosylamino)uracil reductase